MILENRIHPKYQRAVDRVLQALRFEGLRLTPDEDEEKLEITKDGITLAFILDRGRVIQASHSGAKGAERAILDLLCQQSLDRPFRDLCEHGLIGVEYEMRDAQIPHEVKGLLTPDNADLAFSRPQELIRALYQKYRLSHEEDGKNFWSPRPSDAWQKLGPIEKHKKTQKALLDACRDLDLETEGVELVEIRDVTRLILSVSSQQKQKFGNYMIKLERALKRTLEPQIELLFESLEDKNKRLNRNIPKSAPVPQPQVKEISPNEQRLS